MNIFAGWLLFQFRVEKNGISNKKRICEEKIYHIHATSAEEAYNKMLKIGQEEEFFYEENNKNIYYEFIGIIELIELPTIENKNVVWDRFIEKILPMERKNKLIPSKEQLNVFKSHKYKLKI